MFTLTNGDAKLSFSITKVFDDSDFFAGGKSLQYTLGGQSSFIRFEKESYSSIGALERLYRQLLKAYDACSGNVKEEFSYEKDVVLTIEFDNLGHALVNAKIKDFSICSNQCEICFQTDQTFIKQFLHELRNELDNL